MVVLLPIASISGASAAGPALPAAPQPPTPALIEMAVERGELDRPTADRYLVAALRGGPVPEAYSSDTPYRGTGILLELQRRLERLGPGPHRHHLRQALHPVAGFGTDNCGGPGPALTHITETTHFYIEYSAAAIGGGLTILDYETALETAWTKEVDQFGWAPPPVYTPNPAPNSLYPVRIENLGPTTYGFVSNGGTHAGFVGDNPATPWNEGDAYASCMVLNSNYSGFPSPPLASLQATAAHEFNHSIQFGWGALSGANAPDAVFFEGLATWMEDEVFDDSNDNYNFLWPVFERDMGEYGGPLANPYAYWITFRGITEPYGTGVAGGGEDIIQRFWEKTSRNEPGNLAAMDSALQSSGTSLAAAYHAYAIAVKFNKACGGGYQRPHCLEEGPAYVAAKGPTPTHGAVAMDSTYQGSLLDNYALNWIELPQSTDFQAIIRNTSGGGRFRATIACDTGTGLVIAPFSGVVDAGESVFVGSYDGQACATPIAVVTNVTQTAANPSASASRPYTLQMTAPAQPSNLSVRGRAKGNKVIAKGKLNPGGGKVEVTLFKKKGGWKETQSRDVNVSSGGGFKTRFKAPNAKRCRLEAEFDGDQGRLPSSATKRFRC
jgi:hypothetical protein